MDNKDKRFSLMALVMVLTWFCFSIPVWAAASADQGEETMGHGAADDVVVAKVNGKVINMDQLMRTMTHISRTKHGSEDVSPLMAEKIKQEAIDKLVIEELAVQVAAAKMKAVTPDQIETKIQALKKKYKTEDAFQKYVEEDFHGLEGLKNQLKRSLPLEFFIAQEFDAKVTVSDQEVQQAYEAGKKQSFVTEEFIQVNDLLFFLDPADPKSGAEIEKTKQEIVDKYNNDPSQFPPGTFTLQKNLPLDKVKDKDLYEVSKGLKEYGWSVPVNVDGNLHIVQLVGYKAAVNKTLAEVTPKLQQQLRQQKRQTLINNWLAGLKEGADVEVMDLTR